MDITDGFSDLTQDLGKWFKDLRTNLSEWFSTLGDAIGMWFTDLISGLGNWFNDLGTNISSLPSLIVNGFSDLLKLLFVPKDSFLDAKITEVQANLAKKFNMETYEQLLNALKSYVEGTIDFGGYIDISMWFKHMKTIKNFIRGFFYPIILIADVKYLIWLLRGTAPLGDSGGNSGPPSGYGWYH